MLVFRSNDPEKYKHIDFCVATLQTIEEFDAGGRALSRSLTHINSLCMMEQILEMNDQRLKKL